MKKTLLGTALALVIAAPAAQAACTMQELQQKAMTYSQKVQALAQKDPQKLQKFAEKAQDVSKRYQESVAKGTTNYDEICKLYDDLNDEMDKA